MLASDVVSLLGEPPVEEVLAHEGIVALHELAHELVRVGGHIDVSAIGDIIKAQVQEYAF